MSVIHFSGVNIVGISTCVPKDIVRNVEFGASLISDKDQLNKTIQTIGVEQRRVAKDSICTSDLCLASAEKLISELSLEKINIGALIFVSQTPDYILPATACVLQNRLGLSKETIAFDVNLGCSGYVYGLYIAHSLAASLYGKYVLLLAGDTINKIVSKQDKSNAFLFGDAGTATLLKQSTTENQTSFNLFTDGGGEHALKINDGGYRNQTTFQSFEIQKDEDGNLRNALNLYMNGGDIFSFTIREVPKAINQLLSDTTLTIDNLDAIVFHQANQFMINFLANKMKIPQERFLTSLKLYGNTSSASIPLSLVVNCDSRKKYGKTLLSGFGVGLSWANCIVDLSETTILDLIEYE